MSSASAEHSESAPLPTPGAGTILLLLVLGLAIGTWSALCGIGGGVFAVPLLHYGFRRPLKLAVGSSLLLVAGSTSSATITELFRADSALHLGAAATMIATSFVGARIGFALGKRLDTIALKAVFVVLLAVVALDLAFGADPRSAQAVGDARLLALGAPDYVAIAGLGLVAGVVAPLLGVGGGLVAVPGLLFLAPGLGFLGARATSMAMSVFTAWQSVWLHRREKQVELALAAWLALGAIAGGFVGVRLVHVEGATVLAQRLLAATLLFVAVRFLTDVVRGARASGRWGAVR
ncbi:MAG: sulfite exporter TauE/SafE family protein [Planctomycetes bacterium]|nr:sulfite exporter TauE/SafE family protein [Planctomycetota bacterium]